MADVKATDPDKLQGARVLILAGDFQNHEGVCLGLQASLDRYAVSPDDSDQILSLTFERISHCLSTCPPIQGEISALARPAYGSK